MPFSLGLLYCQWNLNETTRRSKQNSGHTRRILGDWITDANAAPTRTLESEYKCGKGPVSEGFALLIKPKRKIGCFRKLPGCEVAFPLQKLTTGTFPLWPLLGQTFASNLNFWRNKPGSNGASSSKMERSASIAWRAGARSLQRAEKTAPGLTPVSSTRASTFAAPCRRLLSSTPVRAIGPPSLLASAVASSPPSSYFQRPTLPANTVIRFVPQQTAWIVERMGKFHRILAPGLAILVPFLDRIAYVKSLKEAAIEIPSQSAITADNVTLELDGVLYTRVFDAYKAR